MALSTAIEPNAVARVLGIKTVFKDLRQGSTIILPQRIAMIGQGNSDAVYTTEKTSFTSALEVAQKYGSGSPLHLASLQFFPRNGGGLGVIPLTVYPLVDDVSGTAGVGNIIPAGSVSVTNAVYFVKIGNIKSAAINPISADTVASIITKTVTAINSITDMPVIASDGTTEVTLTTKWKGTSANGIVVEIDEVVESGLTFAVSNTAAGTTNPVVQPALDQFGGVWETMVLSCLDMAGSLALDTYEAFGEARWDARERKPLVFFTGSVFPDTFTTLGFANGRKNDRINCQLTAPGTNDLNFVIAAAQLLKVVKLANANPAHDYGSQPVPSINPGLDQDQWDYVERNEVVTGGVSTSEVKNGVLHISDVVTMFHPDGNLLPEYRFVVDIVKLQNVLFNLAVEFEQPKWDGAPMIPDDQATNNRTAKKPKSAVAAAALIIRNLGLNAVLADTDATIPEILAEIDSVNPKRLNMIIPVKLSGNANIKSFDLEFGFNFGT